MASIATERAMLKLILSLPGPVLRMLSGGDPVEAGGRTLDPRFQFLAHQSRRNPPMSALTPQQARAGAARGFASAAGRPEPGVRVSDRTVPGAAGELPARLYRPADQDPRAPLIVWFHQGGAVIGDLETSHAWCTILAAGARAPVLSVEYRKAPEHPFPQGLDDALAAFRWARINAAEFGAPVGRAAVGGDSQGGNFAAVICQQLRRMGRRQPDLQVLVYPAVDMLSATQSMTVYADAFPLSRPTMEWFVAHQVPPGVDPGEVRLSPLHEPDLTGLAQAVVVTAGFDPLVDQGEAYAHRLLEAHVPVVYRCYDALAHGFLSFGLIPSADTAQREIAGLVRQAIDGLLPAAAEQQLMTEQMALEHTDL